MSENKRFVLLFGGFCLVLASVLGFMFTVERQSHCQFESVRDDPRGATVTYYSELDAGQQETFQQILSNRDEQFSSDCPVGTIRYNEQYYVIDGWGSIIWTNPPTLGSLAGLLVGLALAYRSLPPELRFLSRFIPSSRE